MKTTAQKNSRFIIPLEHLGGLSAEKFLHEYWQKKPLLIRRAFPHLIEPLTRLQLFDLAGRDDTESRLIARNGRDWQLTHGPISKRQLASVKQSPWTLLVQDTQHFSNEAHDLLAKFNFIPHARVDDLMVSYAVPGGGVGPHVDSYDVFLLQGSGKRRWRISAQKDLRLKENMPLKLLAHFKPEQEFVLETGDMLYLPPGYAHDGVAETECLTWSIGFRAPSSQELSNAFLDYLRDEIKTEGQYSDADLEPTVAAGEIDRRMQARFANMLTQTIASAKNPDNIQVCLGRYLTEPKQHVYFDYPEPELSPLLFRKSVLRHGLELDLRTRLLYDDRRFFINGEQWQIEQSGVALIRKLADTRQLSPVDLAATATTTFKALHIAYSNGFLSPSPEAGKTRN
jgi:50S ribosomal protein L16 3-hydroxylase